MSDVQPEHMPDEFLISLPSFFESLAARSGLKRTQGSLLLENRDAPAALHIA